MTEPTTDKEWADYLSVVLRRLDTLGERKPKDALSLQKHVDEVREPLGHLIGLLYLRGRHAWNRLSADGYRTAVSDSKNVTGESLGDLLSPQRVEWGRIPIGNAVVLKTDPGWSVPPVCGAEAGWSPLDTENLVFSGTDNEVSPRPR